MPEHHDPTTTLICLWQREKRRVSVLVGAMARPMVFRALWMAILLCVCIGLWEWPHRYQRADIFLGADLVAMALLGGIVSAHVPVKPAEKFMYGAVFVILATVGMRLVIQQSNETAQANKDLRDTLKAVATSTAETTRVETLNTLLQKRLLSQSGIIAGLSVSGINTTTGGDSFCYMMFGGDTHDMRPAFFHQGQYPLYDLNVRIVDIKMAEVPAGIVGQALLDFINKAEVKIHLGNMGAGSSFWSERHSTLPFDRSHNAFNVFFDARNGFWHEALRYRDVGTHRAMALIVWREALGGRVFSPKELVIFKKVDKDFPLHESGEVKW